MKAIKNYLDLYLRCGVLLLIDVFEKFRKSSLKNYGLCLSNYFSTPVLNMTNVKLELFPESDMFLFFEKGVKGRVSYISNRYGKAKNKYLKFCDPKKES